MVSDQVEGNASHFPGSTSFYRNAPLLTVLCDICAQLLQRQKPIRVHVFAESTGEETWSLLFELTRRGLDEDVVLEASDLGSTGVLAARRARYPYEALSAIPPDLQHRFFSRRGDHYFVRPQFRDQVRHSGLDVRQTTGSPRSVDLALFQNVLVHMPDQDQRDSLRNLRRAQTPGGFLSLGGVPISGHRSFLEELGYRPFTDRAGEIHDAWETQRKAWLANETPYWALPPFDQKRLSDFCTLFQLGDV